MPWFWLIFGHLGWTVSSFGNVLAQGQLIINFINMYKRLEWRECQIIWWIIRSLNYWENELKRPKLFAHETLTLSWSLVAKNRHRVLFEVRPLIAFLFLRSEKSQRARASLNLFQLQLCNKFVEFGLEQPTQTKLALATRNLNKTWNTLLQVLFDPECVQFLKNGGRVKS